jgi:hypothetical protein
MGQVLSQTGVVQHDRHDRVQARTNRESDLRHAAAEPYGILLQLVAQHRLGAHQVDGLHGGGDDDWR